MLVEDIPPIAHLGVHDAVLCALRIRNVRFLPDDIRSALRRINILGLCPSPVGGWLLVSSDAGVNHVITLSNLPCWVLVTRNPIGAPVHLRIHLPIPCTVRSGPDRTCPAARLPSAVR